MQLPWDVDDEDEAHFLRGKLCKTAVVPLFPSSFTTLSLFLYHSFPLPLPLVPSSLATLSVFLSTLSLYDSSPLLFLLHTLLEVSSPSLPLSLYPSLPLSFHPPIPLPLPPLHLPPSHCHCSHSSCLASSLPRHLSCMLGRNISTPTAFRQCSSHPLFPSGAGAISFPFPFSFFRAHGHTSVALWRFSQSMCQPEGHDWEHAARTQG